MPRKPVREHHYTPADRLRIFRRNRCARSFILRKYIDRFLARRSEGVISVMNFNHWTGGWDPAANAVKSMMISYGRSTRRGSIIVCGARQQPDYRTMGEQTLKTWYTSNSMLMVSASILAANRMNTVTSSSFEGGLGTKDYRRKLRCLHLVECYQ